MTVDEVVNEIKLNGFCRIEQYRKPAELDPLRNDFLATIKRQEKLKSNDANFLMVNQPYYTCPESLQLALDPIIAAVAEQYLGKPVFLGTCNLRRSKLTTAPPVSTNLFHMDDNCGRGVRLIKAFYYLNDVELDGGPFEFIKGSHLYREPGWDSKVRWSDDEIYRIFGKISSVKLTAKYGDLLIADTSGFHRGLQVRKNHRDMLTMNYVTQLERERPVIRKEDASSNPLLSEVILA